MKARIKLPVGGCEVCDGRIADRTGVCVVCGHDNWAGVITGDAWEVIPTPPARDEMVMMVSHDPGATLADGILAATATATMDALLFGVMDD